MNHLQRPPLTKGKAHALAVTRKWDFIGKINVNYWYQTYPSLRRPCSQKKMNGACFACFILHLHIFLMCTFCTIIQIYLCFHFFNFLLHIFMRMLQADLFEEPPCYLTRSKTPQIDSSRECPGSDSLLCDCKSMLTNSQMSLGNWKPDEWSITTHRHLG